MTGLIFSALNFDVTFFFSVNICSFVQKDLLKVKCW